MAVQWQLISGTPFLCAGFDLLAGVADKKVISQMLRAIVNTAHGQAYDITLETLGQWQEDDVINLHKAKTAIYTYENPLKIGGMMAGTSEEALKYLHDYAMDGGWHFNCRMIF